MPTIPAIPTISVPSGDKARNALTDAAYVGVGAAVITVQQAQDVRKEIQERLEDGFAKLLNLRPAEVRTELRDRIEIFAQAGREALGKTNTPVVKPAAKTNTSKVAA